MIEVKSTRYHKINVALRGDVYTGTNGYKDNKVVIVFTELLNLLPDYRDNKEREHLKDVDAKFESKIGNEYYVLEKNTADAVGNLVKQINKTIQEAYDKGKEDGKQAIIMLNTGEITLDQFNKK